MSMQKSTIAMVAVFGALSIAIAAPASAADLQSRVAKTQIMATDEETETLPPEAGDSVPEGEDITLPPVTGENNGELEGGYTGGDVAPPGTPILLDEDDIAKTPGVLNDFVTEGSLTYEQAVAAAKKAGLATELIREPGPRSEPDGAAVTALPSARTLTITHHGQVLSYYCGPATAQMILTGGSGAGWSSSMYDSASRSQSVLARSAYLQTTAARGTPWADGRMKIALNRWVHGTSSGGSSHYWMQLGKPDDYLFLAASQESIGHSGRSMAVNTVEREGSYHYNGHPNKTIGHWIANYGYDKYGYSTGPMFKLADPSTTVWSNASARFAASKTWVYRFVNNGNGIVYSYKRA